MRNSICLVLSLICAAHSYSATTVIVNEPKVDWVLITLPGIIGSLSIKEYIQLSPSDFRKLTGHKLTLKEMIVLKITQKRIKKTIRKDGTIDLYAYQKAVSNEPFKWHWGGFFLGLMLPFGIGVIIAALIKDNKKKNRITSAAIGTCVSSLILLVILFISISNSL